MSGAGGVAFSVLPSGTGISGAGISGSGFSSSATSSSAASGFGGSGNSAAETGFGFSWQSALSSVGLTHASVKAPQQSSQTNQSGQTVSQSRDGGFSQRVQTASTTTDAVSSSKATISAEIPRATSDTLQAQADSEAQDAAAQQDELVNAAAEAEAAAQNGAALTQKHSLRIGVQKEQLSDVKADEKSAMEKSTAGSSTSDSSSPSTTTTEQPAQSQDATLTLPVALPVQLPVQVALEAPAPVPVQVRVSAPVLLDQASSDAASVPSSSALSGSGLLASGSTSSNSMTGLGVATDSISTVSTLSDLQQGLPRMSASPRFGEMNPSDSGVEAGDDSVLLQGLDRGAPGIAEPVALPEDIGAVSGTTIQSAASGATSATQTPSASTPAPGTEFAAQQTAFDPDRALATAATATVDQTTTSKSTAVLPVQSAAATATLNRARAAQSVSSAHQGTAVRTAIGKGGGLEGSAASSTATLSQTTTAISAVANTPSATAPVAVEQTAALPSAEVAADSEENATAEQAVQSVGQSANRVGSAATTGKTEAGKKAGSSSSVSSVGATSEINVSSSTIVSVDQHHLSAAAALNTGTDETGVVRDLASGKSQTVFENAPHSSTPHSVQTAADTFAALDSSATPAPTQWVQAGARHAEAGYQDPNLGWVGVRAEISGGSVHASILPSSASAAEVLGQHMSGLNNYLQDNHSSVSTVSMTSPDGQAGFSSAANSSGQGGGHSSDRSTEQQQPPALSAAPLTAAAIESSGTETYSPSGLGEGRLISLVA